MGIKENPNADFKKKVEESGLIHVIDCHPSSFNMSIMSGLIKRWYPEINTFHLPIGEATITLDDVAKIIGLKNNRIVPSSAKPRNLKHAKDIVHRTLRIPTLAVGALFDRRKGNGVSLSSLCNMFKNSLTADSREEVVDHCLRVFLFYALVHTSFVDKSRERLLVYYLEDLEDVSKIKDIPFGLRCSTNVYYRLGEASRHTCESLAGYMPLVEIWAFLHIPSTMIHGIQERNTWVKTEKKPFITKWHIHHYAEAQTRKVIGNEGPIRRSTTRADFIWMPYGTDDTWEEISLYRGIIFWHEEKETYHPERVLRQFGYKAYIPPLALIPNAPRYSVSEIAHVPRYEVAYAPHENFQAYWRETLLSKEDCEKMEMTDDEYKDWYEFMTHIPVNIPIGYNPNRRILFEEGNSDSS